MVLTAADKDHPAHSDTIANCQFAFLALRGGLNFFTFATTFGAFEARPAAGYEYLHLWTINISFH